MTQLVPDAFFLLSADLLFIWRGDGTIVRANPALVRALGYEPGALEGTSAFELVHEADRDATRERMLARREGRAAAGPFENRLRHCDGTFRWLAWNSTWDEGTGCFYGVARDVSESRRSTEALKEAEDRFQKVFVEGPFGMVLVDEARRLRSANDSFCRLLGYSREELLGRSLDELAHPDDVAADAQMSGQLFAGAVRSYRLEKRYRTRSGELIWVNLTASLVRDLEGKPLYGLRTVEDITSKKRAEEERLQMRAREQELLAHLQQILESTGDGICGVDLEGRCTFANEPGAHMLGGKPPQLVSAELDTLVRRRAGEEGPCAQVLQSGVAVRVEDGVMLRLDGAPFPAAYSVHPIVGDGKLRGAVVSFADITERKRMQAALHESEERTRQILDVVNDAFISVDGAGTITGWNQRAEEIFGWPAVDVIGRELIETLIPVRLRDDPQHRLLQRFSELSAGVRAERLELRALHRDGRELPVEFSLCELRVAGAVSFHAFVHDISERKRAEEQLRSANEQLTAWVSELEQRNREASLLNEMGDLLQSCLTVEESHTVVKQFTQQFFPGVSGALYVLSPARNSVESVATWGETPPVEKVFALEDCWALRRGKTHPSDDKTSGLRCRHLTVSGRGLDEAQARHSLCVPMMAQGEAIGVLHIAAPAGPETQESHRRADARRRLAGTVSEHIALAIANFKLRESLREQSVRDPLTGLFNRRYLTESLERELRRGQRHRRPVGLIMIDVDYFKRYNDTLGHDAGDSLLRALGEYLRTNVRGEDIACRYGGEEFALVLPEASLEGTRARAEVLREKVRFLNATHLNRQLEPVTLSLGVAAFPDHGITPAELLRAADVALYRSKADGRDRVTVYEAPPAGGPLRNVSLLKAASGFRLPASGETEGEKGGR